MMSTASHAHPVDAKATSKSTWRPSCVRAAKNVWRHNGETANNTQHIHTPQRPRSIFVFDVVLIIALFFLTMAPKKIKVVVDASGGESKEGLGSQDGYKELLRRLDVVFLVDEDGYNTNDFESLEDGGTYTLGQRRRQQQQQQQEQRQIMQRTVSCRMWVGDDMTFYELPAPTFQTLISHVVSRFALAGDQEISLYYIASKRDVSSRRYVSNDDDLNNLFALAGKPILFVWLRGDPSMSPQSIPSQLELQHMSLSDSESISASSGRGYPQELFRNAVRGRDNQKCVLTGTQLRPKTGNVQAAHIIGVERSLTEARHKAGIWNAYDTQNGMLLESSLHTDFDSFFWCMDEFLNVHVSEAGRGKGLGYLDGKKLNLRLGEQNYPSRKILRARYALFLDRTRARESKLDTKKRRRKHITAFTV